MSEPRLRRPTIADPISRTVSTDVVRYEAGPHYLTSTASATGIVTTLVVLSAVYRWRVRVY